MLTSAYGNCINLQFKICEKATQEAAACFETLLANETKIHLHVFT